MADRRGNWALATAGGLVYDGWAMDFKLAVAQAGALVSGWIRQRRSRRNLMFVLCMGTLALVGLGFFLLERWLEEHPLVYLGYWGFTGIAAVLMMMLALYDMLRTARERDG